MLLWVKHLTDLVSDCLARPIISKRRLILLTIERMGGEACTYDLVILLHDCMSTSNVHLTVSQLLDRGYIFLTGGYTLRGSMDEPYYLYRLTQLGMNEINPNLAEESRVA